VYIKKYKTLPSKELLLPTSTQTTQSTSYYKNAPYTQYILKIVSQGDRTNRRMLTLSDVKRHRGFFRE